MYLARKSKARQQSCPKWSPSWWRPWRRKNKRERLLQYAISHHVGATDYIKARVSAWRGVIAFTTALDTLLDVARNGDDLRVRAAALEIELAALNIAKTSAQADALLERIAIDPTQSRQEIYVLGILANRGIATTRVHDALRGLARSENELIRYQAYAAIANIGTDETVSDLVDAFHHDPSAMVRIDGGGCGLAHCGMLTRAQRMLAVPGLIEMAADNTVDRPGCVLRLSRPPRNLGRNPARQCTEHGGRGMPRMARRPPTGFASSRRAGSYI